MGQIVCEIGVNYPHLSQVLTQADVCDKIILIEPEPDCYRAIQEYLDERPTLKKKTELFNVAIDLNPGRVKMIQTGMGCQSSCLKKIPKTPLKSKQPNRHFQEIEVFAVPFSSIDPGNITHLYIDTEGAEWFVLQDMKSRPEMIKLEMGNPKHFVRYQNPYFNHIMVWMKLNEYTFHSQIESDMIFKKK
jgi:FkbM family methyltransferase